MDANIVGERRAMKKRQLRGRAHESATHSDLYRFALGLILATPQRHV